MGADTHTVAVATVVTFRNCVTKIVAVVFFVLLLVLIVVVPVVNTVFAFASPMSMLMIIALEVAIAFG